MAQYVGDCSEKSHASSTSKFEYFKLVLVEAVFRRFRLDSYSSSDELVSSIALKFKKNINEN